MRKLLLPSSNSNNNVRLPSNRSNSLKKKESRKLFRERFLWLYQSLLRSNKLRRKILMIN